MLTPITLTPAERVLHELGILHGFTRSHLDANRAGLLHPEQIAAGVRFGMGDVRFGRAMFALAAMLILIVCVFPAFPNAIRDLDFHFEMPAQISRVTVGMFLGGLAGSIPLVLGYFAWREGRRVVAAYQRGRVEMVVGPVLPVVVRRPSRTNEHYRVGNLRLRVARKAWGTMKGGQVYRVYYVRGPFVVMSLEPDACRFVSS